MSPEHGPGPEEQEFKAGSEEVEAERDAREEGRLRRAELLEGELESVEASIEKLEEDDSAGDSEVLRRAYAQQEHLQEQLRKLEGDN